MFPSTAKPQAHLSSGEPLSHWSSAALVFQNVESFLVLCLKRHNKVVRGDFPPAVLVHLAHENVVQASSDKWTLLAQDNDLGAHGLSCLLDGQAAFFIYIDDGDSGVHTSTSHHCSNDSPAYHEIAGTVIALKCSLSFAFLLAQGYRVFQRYWPGGDGLYGSGGRYSGGGEFLWSELVVSNEAVCGQTEI